MQDQKTRLIDKIRALFALSKSPNQAEAEYQISMTDVSAKNLGEVEAEDYVVEGAKVKYKFVSYIAQAAAQLYDCTLIHSRRLHTNEFQFVGYPNDEAAKATFEYLWGAWRGIVETDLEEAKNTHRLLVALKQLRRWAPKDTMTFKHSHGNGFVIAILARVKDLVDQRRKEVAKESVLGNQLTVVKDKGVKNYLSTRKLSRTKGPLDSKSQSGSLMGKAAGEAIPLKGLGTSAPVAAIGRR